MRLIKIIMETVKVMIIIRTLETENDSKSRQYRKNHS